ncbi:MAG: hypothetical protein ABIV48_10865, partial [Pyrinomonadaceae bacterium]
EEPVFESSIQDTPASTSAASRPVTSARLDSPPVRLPTLSSSDLEHFDDQKLDDAYDEKLSLTGDDLLPISGSDKLVETLLGEVYIKPTYAPKMVSGNSAAAAVPAFDIAKFKEEIASTLPDVELPVLGNEPTPEELLEFANAHSSVRTAMRVFRAKIIDVKKI